MHDRLFEVPVTIRHLAGADEAIASLADMELFLGSWRGRRGQLHEIALKACAAAAKDYITMEQARRTLVAFASAMGRLRHDLEPEIAGRNSARLGIGYTI